MASDELTLREVLLAESYEAAEKLQKARIAELEAALREIADGHIDSGGNRRNHGEATAIARRALGIV